MKRIKDMIVGIIVGMLLVGVPVMAVSYIPSKDVSYKTDYNENVTNVEDALDILTNQVKDINNTGTSLASDILSGKTAYVNGKLLTGSMANYSGANTTASNITKNGDNAEITLPGGYYDGDSKIIIPIDTINSNLGGSSGEIILGSVNVPKGINRALFIFATTTSFNTQGVNLSGEIIKSQKMIVNELVLNVPNTFDTTLKVIDLTLSGNAGTIGVSIYGGQGTYSSGYKVLFIK